MNDGSNKADMIEVNARQGSASQLLVRSITTSRHPVMPSGTGTNRRIRPAALRALAVLAATGEKGQWTANCKGKPSCQGRTRRRHGSYQDNGDGCADSGSMGGSAPLAQWPEEQSQHYTREQGEPQGIVK